MLPSLLVDGIAFVDTFLPKHTTCVSMLIVRNSIPTTVDLSLICDREFVTTQPRWNPSKTEHACNSDRNHFFGPPIHRAFSQTGCRIYLPTRSFRRKAWPVFLLCLAFSTCMRVKYFRSTFHKCTWPAIYQQTLTCL